jgi:hypothetical protein
MDLPTNIRPPLHHASLSPPQADLLSLLNEDHTTQHNNYSPCLDNNSEERSHHYTSIHDIGCQSSLLLQNMVTVIKKKLRNSPFHILIHRK